MEVEMLKRKLGIRECSVILQKPENEPIGGRGEGSEAHQNNQQLEANALNGHANLMVELLERSR